MFTRKSKPVEERVHRVIEATGRTPELRREDEPPGDYFRAAAPGPIPPRRIVEPEPEPSYPAPGRDAAPIDQVSSLRHNVMQRVEREPEKEESAIVARLRGNWLRDRPDPLVLGAVVVVAAVVGLVMLPLLFRGGSKKGSTAQNPTTVAAQPSSVATSGKATVAPARSSGPIFAAETPIITPAAARPAASPPAIGAQATTISQPGTSAVSAGSAASPASGLGPAARTVATPAATPAPGATPPLTRPARSAPLAPPDASPSPESGPSLANVVGSAAAAQPPPVPAQVGTSSPGQVTIPGVTSSGGSRGGVAPARAGSGGGGSAPVAAAAPVQPTTIAPSLDDIAAQAQRAASAASSRGGH